jgi:hypothetical protein
VYIKVKDATGNVSGALKISVPAYSVQTQSPAPTPEPTAPESGGILYQNPDFPGIKISFGNP